MKASELAALAETAKGLNAGYGGAARAAYPGVGVVAALATRVESPQRRELGRVHRIGWSLDGRRIPYARLYALCISSGQQRKVA